MNLNKAYHTYYHFLLSYSKALFLQDFNHVLCNYTSINISKNKKILNAKLNSMQCNSKDNDILITDAKIKERK